MARVKASTYLLRCRPDTLQRARIVARASGVSLRVWIESAILASLQDAPEVPEALLHLPKHDVRILLPDPPATLPASEPPRPRRPKARV